MMITSLASEPGFAFVFQLFQILSSMTLGKLCPLSVPQFLYLSKEGNKNKYFIGLLYQPGLTGAYAWSRVRTVHHHGSWQRRLCPRCGTWDPRSDQQLGGEADGKSRRSRVWQDGPKMHLTRASSSWKWRTSGSRRLRAWGQQRAHQVSQQLVAARAHCHSTWHPAPSWRAWEMAAPSFPLHIPSTFLLWPTLNRVIPRREFWET